MSPDFAFTPSSTDLPADWPREPGDSVTFGVTCSGWEDAWSPKPTCWPNGCEMLDREGFCPGITPALSEAERAIVNRFEASPDLFTEVCPRCANGLPGCTDRRADGSVYTHAETCALYEWADDVCAECDAELRSGGAA